jgi:transposase InsO family protein
MAETIKEERLRWIRPIVNKKVRLIDVARVCPHSKRSLERWVAAYRRAGASALEPRSTEPNAQPNETPIAIKEEIIAHRKKTKLCAQKLHWRLKKQGLIVPVRTIGKIIKEERLTRKYRTKKVKYKYLKATRKPGELIEIDVKHVPGKIAGKPYFQYTAVDCASRWRHLRIFDEESSYHSVEFLNDVIKRFPHPILAIKTDNHSTFTNRHVGGLAKRSDMTPAHQHGLDTFCAERGIVHYLIDPGKPAQNGTIERSHREDQEKLYDRHTFASVAALKKKLRRWNIQYNDLEHCGLDGKTPNEMLADYQLTNPPNVLA